MTNANDAPIAVLGAGTWGTVLALQLAKKGLAVNLWEFDSDQVRRMQQDRCNDLYLPGIYFPTNLSVHAEIATAVLGVRDILLVVPSHAFRSTLEAIQPHVAASVRIAWATKGLDSINKLLHEAVEEIIGLVPMAVLSGPSFAKEVAKGLPTAITIAADDEHFKEDLVNWFASDVLRLYTNNDLVGVEIAGAVKNVLAIAVGIADGLGFGANTRAALVTRGLAELTRLGLVLGGKAETFMGLAGIGDLLLTCTDDQSRNRRFGLEIGAGKDIKQAQKNINQVIEGIINAKEIYWLSRQHKIEMPITEQVYKVIYEDFPVEAAAASLMQRGFKTELD